MSEQSESSTGIRSIGFVIFDGIERLDLEGPLGVLGWTSRLLGGTLEFRVVSKHGRPVRDHLFGREVHADGATTSHDRFDLLIVPGGDLDKFIGDDGLVDEIRRLGAVSSVVASVCTGAFLVARAGLADDKLKHRPARSRWVQQSATSPTVGGAEGTIRPRHTWRQINRVNALQTTPPEVRCPV